MNDDIKSLPNGDFYVVRKDKPKETPMSKPTAPQPKVIRSQRSK